MEMPDEARRRIETEDVVWLTTVTDSGAPAPNPVWFIPEGDDLLVCVEPHSVKSRNIAARPRVTLHFETHDPSGADVVVLHGSAVLEFDVAPSGHPGFIAKYAALMAQIGYTTEMIDAFSTRVRFTPKRVRVGV